MTPEQFTKAREKLKIGKTALARKLNCTVRAVQKWEKGENPISGSIAQAMYWQLFLQSRGSKAFWKLIKQWLK